MDEIARSRMEPGEAMLPVRIRGQDGARARLCAQCLGQANHRSASGHYGRNARGVGPLTAASHRLRSDSPGWLCTGARATCLLPVRAVFH